MGKMVVEVIDYVVTDSGQVVGKYNMFLDRTRQKQDRNVSLALPPSRNYQIQQSEP
jgi:hypothetical protein